MELEVLVEAKNLDKNIKILKSLDIQLPRKNKVIASQMLRPILKYMKMLLNLGYYHDKKPSMRSQLQITMTGDGGVITGPKSAFAVEIGSKAHPIRAKWSRALSFQWKRLVRDPRSGRYMADDLGRVALKQVKHPGTMRPRVTMHFTEKATDLAFANDYDKIAAKELSSIKLK